MTLDSAFLLISGLICVGVLVRWHTRKDEFDLRLLLLDADMRLSLYKLGQLVALLVSTWVLIHETRVGKLNEWLFGSYMIAWTGVNIAAKLADKKQ